MSFLYSSVYSCHLFLISYASVRSISFLSFIGAHLCMKCPLGICNFLEDTSSLYICCCCCYCCRVASVMSDSVRPHRWQPTRLPRPWDSPCKNTGVGCHFLLQCMKVKSEGEVAQLCPAIPWTAAYQAPPSMGFSRQEYWSGVPLPSPVIYNYSMPMFQKLI